MLMSAKKSKVILGALMAVGGAKAQANCQNTVAAINARLRQAHDNPYEPLDKFSRTVDADGNVSYEPDVYGDGTIAIEVSDHCEQRDGQTQCGREELGIADLVPVFGDDLETADGKWLEIGDMAKIISDPTNADGSEIPPPSMHGDGTPSFASWEDARAQLWINSEEPQSVRIKCEAGIWSTVQILGNIGRVCYDHPGDIRGDAHMPATMLDAIGLAPTTGWGDHLSIPGNEYYIGQRVGPRDCDTWWPHHPECPGEDEECTLARSGDAKLMCDGKTGRYSPEYGVKLSERVSKQAVDETTGRQMPLQNCEVTNASLTKLLAVGNPYDENVDCTPELRAAGTACKPEVREATSTEGDPMFVLQQGSSSCSEGHIEPGYLFKIGNAVTAGPSFEYSKRGSGASVADHISVECNGETGEFVDLQVDTQGALFGRKCRRDDYDLHQDLLAFGLKPINAHDPPFSTSTGVSMTLSPEFILEMGHAVEALEPDDTWTTFDGEIQVESDHAFTYPQNIDIDGGSYKNKFYYYASTHAEDLTAECDGVTGKLKAFQVSDNLAPYLRAPANEGEASPGVMYKCDPAGYGGQADALPPNEDPNGYGDPNRQSATAQDTSGLFELFSTADPPRLQSASGLIKKPDLFDEEFDEPENPKQSYSNPKDAEIQIGSLVEPRAGNGFERIDGGDFIGPEVVTMKCNGENGRFDTLTVDFLVVRIGRTCERDPSIPGGLEELVNYYGLTLLPDPNMIADKFDVAGYGRKIGKMVKGLGDQVYDTEAAVPEDVIVYCSGETGRYHNIYQSPTGRTKKACSALSGWTYEELDYDTNPVGATQPEGWAREDSRPWRDGWGQLNARLALLNLKLAPVNLGATEREAHPGTTLGIGHAVVENGDDPLTFYSGEQADTIRVDCDGYTGLFGPPQIKYVETRDEGDVPVYGQRCDPMHFSMDELLAIEGLKKKENADRFANDGFQDVGYAYDILGAVEPNGWIDNSGADGPLTAGPLKAICGRTGAWESIKYGEGNMMCKAQEAGLNEVLVKDHLIADMSNPYFATMVAAGTYFSIGKHVDTLPGTAYAYDKERAELSSVQVRCDGTTGMFVDNNGDAPGAALFPTGHCGDDTHGCKPQQRCSMGSDKIDVLLESIHMEKIYGSPHWASTQTDETTTYKMVDPGLVKIGDGIQPKNSNVHYSGPMVDGAYDSRSPEMVQIYCDGTAGDFVTTQQEGLAANWDGHTDVSNLPGIVLGDSVVLGAVCPKRGSANWDRYQQTKRTHLEQQLFNEGLKRDPAADLNGAYQGTVAPGQIFEMADIIVAKDNDHYYSGRDEDITYPEQVKTECPGDGPDRFSGLFRDLEIDREENRPADSELDIPSIKVGRLCLPTDTQLLTLLRNLGLAWKGVNGEVPDARVRPEGILDISNDVTELVDNYTGDKYHLAAKKELQPGEDRIGAIDKGSITAVCGSNGGSFSEVIVDRTLVLLGKRCYKNQLFENESEEGQVVRKLFDLNLERKPDNGFDGQITYGSWAGYVAPGQEFHMALMLHGLRADDANDTVQWYYDTPPDRHSDKVYATCDEDGTGAFGPILFRDLPESGTDLRPKRQCHTLVQSGNGGNQAHTLLAGNGLEVKQEGAISSEYGTFINPGTETDVSALVQSNDAARIYYDAQSQTDFVKLTCSGDREKPGQFDVIAIDRDNANAKLGYFCRAGLDSARKLHGSHQDELAEVLHDDNADPRGANTQQIAEANLAPTAEITLTPGETAAIQENLDGAAGYKLVSGTTITATCGDIDGEFTDLALDSNAVGKICGTTDGSLEVSLNSYGMKLKDASVLQATTNPTEELQLAVQGALEALDDGHYYNDDDMAGAGAPGVEEGQRLVADCDQTDGTLSVRAAPVIARKENDKMGEKCAMWADPSRMQPHPMLVEVLLAENFELENPDNFKVYWNTKVDSDNWIWWGSTYTSDEPTSVRYTNGHALYDEDTAGRLIAGFRDADADEMVIPSTEIHLGRMVKATQNYYYDCSLAMRTGVDIPKSCALGDNSDHVEFVTERSWQSQACGPEPNGIDKGGNFDNQAQKQRFQCDPGNVIMRCDGMTGHFKTEYVDQDQLQPVKQCSRNDLIAGEASAEVITMLAKNKMRPKTDMSREGYAGAVNSGDKIAVGTLLEASEAESHLDAQDDNEIKLVCNGRSGKFEEIEVQDGKGLSKTCALDGGALETQLEQKGLKKNGNFDGEFAGQRSNPGEEFLVGHMVEVDTESYKVDSYRGTQPSDVRVVCDGSDGTFKSIFVESDEQGPKSPVPLEGTLRVIKTSVDFKIHAQCENNADGSRPDASQCVTYDQLEQFKLLFQEALRGSLTDDENVIDVEVLDLKAENTVDMARRLLTTTRTANNPLGSLLLPGVRAQRMPPTAGTVAKQNRNVRALGETQGLDMTMHADYQVILAADISDADLEKVARTVGSGDSAESKLMTLRLEQDVAQGLEQLAQADKDGQSSFALATVSKASRPRTSVMDAQTASTRYGNVSSSRGSGSMASRGSGYGSSSRSREDAYANNAFSSKSLTWQSLLLACFMVLASGLLRQ